MRKTAVIMLMLCASAAFAGDPGAWFQVTPTVMLQDFRWEERSDKGETLLLETGPLYTFGVTPRLSFEQRRGLHIELSLSYSVGYVNYYGFLQTNSGHVTQYTTKSGYTHFEGLINTGYTFVLFDAFRMTPVGGFGIELWNRDLGVGAAVGYEEIYSVTLVSAGLHVEVTLIDGFRVFSVFHVRYPLDLTESVDLSSRGQGGPAKLNLFPGITPRYLLRSGIRVSRFLIGFSVEHWTLTKSEASQGFYQPESKRSHIGVMVGYTLGAE
jgi:hypothetical protein